MRQITRITLILIALLFATHVSAAENIANLKNLAKQGHAEKQYELGNIYSLGNRIPQDYSKALYWNHKAAVQGHAKAQYELGKFYGRTFKTGIEIDFTGLVDFTQWRAEKRKWYSKAAEQGYAKAQFELGILYLGGVGHVQEYEQIYKKGYKQNFSEYVKFNRKRNLEGRKKWFSKAAKQGHAKAQVRLGDIYKSGIEVTKNYKEAAKWYRKAAEQGHAKAQTKLGVMFYKGQGVTQDYVSANKFFNLAAKSGNLDAIKYKYIIDKKLISTDSPNHDLETFCCPRFELKYLAEQGHVESQLELAAMYREGSPMIQGYKWRNGIWYHAVPKDIKEAVKWYRKAANRGSVRAQSTLGKFYEKGQGVPKDIKEAVKWYHKAANGGGAPYELGKLYEKGQGVPKDIKEAVKWYHKAANHYNSQAQFRLGELYEKGQEGVPKDIKKAVKWYVYAAKSKNPEGMVRLGELYEKGQVVPKDLNKAYYLYGEAASRRNKVAIKKHKILSKKLFPAASSKAKAKAVKPAKSKAVKPAKSTSIGLINISFPVRLGAKNCRSIFTDMLNCIQFGHFIHNSASKNVEATYSVKLRNTFTGESVKNYTETKVIDAGKDKFLDCWPKKPISGGQSCNVDASYKIISIKLAK